ncbi:MAG: amidohydrolase family protein [Bacteroidota bacterium]
MYRLLTLGLLLAACNSAPSQEAIPNDATVISNVNIINVRDGSIDENKSIVISNGQISQILDKKPKPPDGANQINGKGKYLMPGLAEMHAHIPSPEWGRNRTEETLFLYLSNGVTTIRGMLGHPVHLELREQAKQNEILSPRIFTSSPSLNGNTVPTPEEAREKVTAYQQDGYDFLKIHPGIPLDAFDELVKTANEVGINFAGHVPVDVGIRHALESGYASVDHVDGFLEGLVPESAHVQPDQNGFFGYNFTDLADESKIDELVQMTHEYNVWVVPTQSLFDRWFSPENANALARASEMQYMPASTIENWVSSKQNLVNNDGYSADQWETFNIIRQKLIYQLHHNGHGLLLGSDAPQVFNVPGFSIHHELRGMLDAGLTPLEAIQIGTLNPAKYFGMEGEFGEVIPGASADLILLNANPLDNIEALQGKTGVMVRGRWLSQEEIDRRLSEIAKVSAQL